MEHGKSVTTGVLVLAWLAGCGVTASELGSETAPLVTANGQTQNGQNGQMQNGQMQNGATLFLTGANLLKVYKLITPPDAAHPDPLVAPSNIVAVPNVHLDKGTLTDGTNSGSAFVGHIIEGMMSNGVKAWIYIDDVRPRADDPEILYYVIRVNHQFVPAPGQTCTGPNGNCAWMWDYACGKAGDSPIPAIAIGGQWDYQQGVPGGGRKLIEQSSASYNRQITFGCTNGAIGKCVDTAGYKPWALAKLECSGSGPGFHCQQPTKELLHEACVRMVRADYCGDGMSHTVNGVDIDLWDQSQVNTMSPYSQTSSNGGVPFGHEAEWTANGARCLSGVFAGRVASSHFPGQALGDYLKTTPQCGQKWATQSNQIPYPFSWDDGDCFGRGPVSARSTYDFANVPWSASGPAMDLHDRVLIRNKSVCVDDGIEFDPSINLYNPLRYARPWCSVCVVPPEIPMTCGLTTFPD
ncbi:MAG TPA: ADYC domain-containing protein [Kofleriaceae bacterium]|nr:ADYC domain-containing protein [Kofleriaceae bacterium]